MPLVLASGSPRRAELLEAAGFAFRVQPADVDESVLAQEDPRPYALRVASAKADRVAEHCRESGTVVLAADTVVVVADRILGKPGTEAEAFSMLKALSGVVHEVHTGVVVRAGPVRLCDVVTTRVHLLPLTDSEIAWYIGTGEPWGKAGGYAIQGRAARFVDWIEGSWSNVVGLPISTVHRLLTAVAERD
ncbi:MAG TPA: Maf family protein [Vicinamibacterales bacterium]|nr:Maf family protein [Vicinamibacterales bacterium]